MINNFATCYRVKMTHHDDIQSPNRTCSLVKPRETISSTSVSPNWSFGKMVWLGSPSTAKDKIILNIHIFVRLTLGSIDQCNIIVLIYELGIPNN